MIPTINSAAIERFALVRDAVSAKVATVVGSPLLDEGLRALAVNLIAASISQPIAWMTWTVWPTIYVVFGGMRLEGPWSSFAAWHAEQTTLVQPKGEGATYNPTDNVGGIRNNAHTAAVNALLLDCDETGDWHDLLGFLHATGIAYVAHRSGGHRPGSTRWRVAIPLRRPFSIIGDERSTRWKATYATMRTVLGAIARLHGKGFDPKTETPQHAWYTGARRSEQDPPREMFAADGASIDVEAIVAALPAPAVAHPWQRPEHLVNVGDEGCLLERAFHAVGMLGRTLTDERVAVRCPWNEQHTDPLGDRDEPTSSTVIFVNDDVGTFWCSHRCGHQPATAVVAALPLDVVDRAQLEVELKFGRRRESHSFGGLRPLTSGLRRFGGAS